jgi:hypothetical protein
MRARTRCRALPASLCAGGLLPAIAEGTLALAGALEAVKAEPELVRQTDVELHRRDLNLACIPVVHGQAIAAAAPRSTNAPSAIAVCAPMPERTLFRLGASAWAARQSPWALCAAEVIL